MSQSTLFRASRPSSMTPRSRFSVLSAIAVPMALIGCLLVGIQAQATVSEATREHPSLSASVTAATTRYQFDLVNWEAAALADSLAQRAKSTLLLPSLGEPERLALVDQYRAASAEASRLQRQLASQAVVSNRGAAQQDAQSEAQLQQRLAVLERQCDRLVPTVEEIMSSQIDDYLVHAGIGTGLLHLDWRWSFPPLSFSVEPPVLFRFQRLPLLLVVAPRDRIEVLQGLFLKPQLSVAQMEGVESEIDRQNVKSLVIPIGGFAAFPSMIPMNQPIADTMIVVAHEWVHHYLAMHPLGQRYFADYSMRSINETVADMVGHEVGEAVYQRYYQSAAAADTHSAFASDAAAASGTSFDFAQAMAETRRTAEAMLDRGDVAAAEQYMADRKQWFASNGYYLRKLNTAYLTFYGAYAGAGNNYEPKLRLLRQHSTSLADFLHRVDAITSEQDLETLTAGLD